MSGAPRRLSQGDVMSHLSLSTLPASRRDGSTHRAVCRCSTLWARQAWGGGQKPWALFRELDLLPAQGGQGSALCSSPSRGAIWTPAQVPLSHRGASGASVSPRSLAPLLLALLETVNLSLAGPNFFLLELSKILPVISGRSWVPFSSETFSKSRSPTLLPPPCPAFSDSQWSEDVLRMSPSVSPVPGRHLTWHIPFFAFQEPAPGLLSPVDSLTGVPPSRDPLHLLSTCPSEQATSMLSPARANGHRLRLRYLEDRDSPKPPVWPSVPINRCRGQE